MVVAEKMQPVDVINGLQRYGSHGLYGLAAFVSD
jgi:hypothetical protein